MVPDAERSPVSIRQPTQALPWIVLLGMTITAFDYIIESIHWPLMLDSPVMHYVVFLLQHGLKPYSQITDINMPGAYLTEWFAMSVFGPADLSWRIYEFFLLAVLAAGMCVVAGRRNWIAGIYAAGVFLAMHAAEGPREAVERDEVIAVLIMVSYAALCIAVRERKPFMMVIGGLTSGIAATIKPTFLPFDIFLLVMTYLQLIRQQVSPSRYLAWGSAGLLAAGGTAIGFVVHYDAVRDLLFILHTVIPAYRSTGHPLAIAVHTIPKPFILVLFLVFTASAGNYLQGARWNWERWMVFGGVVFGLISYFIQGQGFPYHRYEYLVCLFLLSGMEIFASIRGKMPWRWAGLAAIAITMAYTVPHYICKLNHVRRNSDFTLALERDLQAFGGAQTMQDRVVCLDMTTGCLNAIYHLRIVENGGYTGDMLLFTKQQNAATKYYRNVYWQRTLQDPPQVIVVSNQDMFNREGFNRLDNWPFFNPYLRDNFTKVIERNFPYEGVDSGAAPASPQDAAAYRIYISNESPLLESAGNIANH